MFRSTGRNTKRLQSFSNRCLRCILGIKWYDKVTNECLWVNTGQAKIEDEIRKRKWRWIGHTLEKAKSNIGKSWRELEILAKVRRTWNVIVTGLCPHGS
jgi:hypothetical protein